MYSGIYKKNDMLEILLTVFTDMRRTICWRFDILIVMLDKLEKKYGKQFKLYANTKVATVDGKLKNEFDLIIENVTDALVYVIEIKSGKQFRDYDKLARIS